METKSEKEESEKERQVKKLNKGLELYYLAKGNEQRTWEYLAPIYTNRYQENFVSRTYLNRLKKGKISDTNIGMIGKVNTFLEQEIKKEFNKIWKNGEYVDMNVLEISDIQRLDSLVGVWRVYTWDAYTTRRLKDNQPDVEEGKKGYVHFFKFKYQTFNSIKIQTRNFDTDQTRLVLVDNSKLLIEFLARDRNITMIINLKRLEGEYLAKTKCLDAAYVDSGNDHVKCGLAILERTQEEYESIEPHTIPYIEIIGRLDIDFSILKESQKVILR